MNAAIRPRADRAFDVGVFGVDEFPDRFGRRLSGVLAIRPIADHDLESLLGEMLDAMQSAGFHGPLPPLFLTRVCNLLSRWWELVSDQPKWQQRARALREAEQLNGLYERLARFAKAHAVSRAPEVSCDVFNALASA